MAPDEHFLHDTITAALIESMGADQIDTDPELAARWAGAILAALAGRADESWVTVRRDQVLFEAATPTGARAVQISSCAHYWEFSNAGFAGNLAAVDGRDVDYLHICVLDELICSLVGLRELYRRHRAGEPVTVCDHSTRDGGGMCQACGNRVVVVDAPEPFPTRGTYSGGRPAGEIGPPPRTPSGAGPFPVS